ncbi:hypothetical protein GCM10012287_44190 [Streptomyces daqingensis]|uniref:M23ase beta-sheet core domain-containing protein n=1 Tax=Streptomyces daqingensis TaxID=1472640 RepID=A0ABQ2MNT1_9ACTN|nr:M23 family metallopeptidase [Streptomyces daqingensis]GGO54680.1 hypothetical protein GCM10012287_44190 [Streptomyces daqingensis]
MQKRTRRMLAAVSVAAAVVVTAPLAVAQAGETTSSEETLAARPAFKMPFKCGQRWRGANWNGHSPGHSVDWNHYNSAGTPDDLGRKVLASAGGKVLNSYYSKTTGYGNTIVIGHGNGWQTRYAHLHTRAVSKGASVKAGQVIGKVGKTSAKYELSPHLHYEQIHSGSVVVSVLQGVKYPDFTTRFQVSKNGC